MARSGAVEIRRSSRLRAGPDEVWAAASTMAGVNAELRPLVRMTYPHDRSSLRAGDVPLGEVLFHSWLLLFGVVPIDRHALRLQHVFDVGETRGFDEDSTSWLQCRWCHQRRITPQAGGCLVTDLVVFEPRARLAQPVVQWVVESIFDHRHRALRRRFGTAAEAERP